MTQLNTAIRFNNSTGSDTAASGVGPATAVTGSGASTTASSAVVTGISTTGVTAGDLLWVQSSSGRQFSVIASVDSSTQVTCDDQFANTESSRTWAIGGKRATLDDADSRLLFTDAPSQSTGSGAGWKLDLENTGSNYTISSNIALRNQIIIEGLGTSKVVIEQTSNASHFTASSRKFYHRFKNIQFVNSNPTKTSAVFSCTDNGPNLILVDCIVGSDVSSERVHRCLYKFGLTAVNVFAYKTTFKNAVADNIRASNGSLSAYFDSCKIVDAGGSGFYRVHNSGVLFLNNCIVANNTNEGIYYTTSAYAGDCYNTIFYNNGSHGFVASSLSTASRIRGCIFAENGGYGFRAASVLAVDSPMVQSNAFYSNASGGTDNVSFDSTNLTLTADPFVDAANGDFNLNADASGGADLRSNNYTVGG